MERLRPRAALGASRLATSLLVGVACFASCVSPPPSRRGDSASDAPRLQDVVGEPRPDRLGLAVSVSPNVGLEGVWQTPLPGGWTLFGRPLDLDVHVTQQFLDDEAVSDDGNPAAGDWTQLGVALRWSTEPVDRRAWTFRVGPEWFRARGVPNVIDVAGDYGALRLGAGYEMEVAPGAFVGPELSVMLAHGPESFRLVPQVVWGVRFDL